MLIRIWRLINNLFHESGFSAQCDMYEDYLAVVLWGEQEVSVKVVQGEGCRADGANHHGDNSISTCQDFGIEVFVITSCTNFNCSFS